MKGIIISLTLAMTKRIILQNNVHLTRTQSILVEKWLEEISRIKQKGINQILNFPKIRSILHNEGLSPYQKGDKLYNLLYRMRYPVMSDYQDKFKKLSNFIYHRTGAKIYLPYLNFECNEIIVEPKEKISDVKKFKKQIDSLMLWKPILK